MRLREWFSWHFPELSRIVQDNAIYAQLVNLIENKNNATEELLPKLEELTLDEDKAREIVEAAKISMG
jgi:nucleolar protein 56